MKIALCLHGLFDSATDTHSKGIDGYHHIKKNILDRGDVDVYIHSWNVENENKICDLYKPKDFIFEKSKDFSELIYERSLHTLKGMPRSPESVLSHLYSVSQSISLPYKVCNYDIVIKSRFDLGRINRQTSGPGKQNPYPVQCINFITNIENGKIYNADWNHFTMGPADMWFYGDYEIMKNFTTLYDDLKSVMVIDSEFHNFAKSIQGNPGDLSNSIAFYKWWMMKKDLWNNRINLSTTWE
jgi:hypothetical protein